MNAFLPYLTLTAMGATVIWFALYITALREGLRESQGFDQPKLDDIGEALFLSVKAAFVFGLIALYSYGVFSIAS